MADALHITPIENLDQIVERGGLWTDNHLRRVHKSKVVSVTDQEIKDKRAKTKVRGAGGSTLADYVPFHLTWRTRAHWLMEQRSSRFVIFVIDTDTFARDPGCFHTDRHPLATGARWYEGLRGLSDHVDLRLITTENPRDHPGREVLWDAEVLVPTMVRLWQIDSVVVRTDRDANVVVDAMAAAQRPPKRWAVRPEWYDWFR